jgi:hypothetical protein
MKSSVRKPEDVGTDERTLDFNMIERCGLNSHDLGFISGGIL